MPNLDLRDRLNELIQQREALEAEAESIRSFLEAPGPNGAAPPGLRGVALVDSEGFPRSDIDVYDARLKRYRLACVETDHQELMKKIEELVKEIHAEAKPNLPSVSSREVKPSSELSTQIAAATTTTTETTSSSSPLPQEQKEAFAIIDEVFPNSPAMEAGLLDGDLLLSFGSIDAGNYGGTFNAIAQLVQNSVNRAIPVSVKRSTDGETVRVELIPHTWSGRGLLGCHLSPLTS